MPQDQFTKEQFWSELDKLDEDEVRLKIKLNKFSSVNKKKELAEEWLRRKTQSRLDRRDDRNTKRQMIADIAAIVAAVAATIGAISSIIILFSK